MGKAKAKTLLIVFLIGIVLGYLWHYGVLPIPQIPLEGIIPR